MQTSPRFLIASLCVVLSLGTAGANASGARHASCLPPAPAPLHAAIQVTTVLGPGHPSQMVNTGGGLYVLDSSSGEVTRLSAEGKPLGGFRIPLTDVGHGLAVDRRGDFYVGRYPFALVKYSPSGKVLWTRPVKDPLASVFVIGRGASQRVGVTAAGFQLSAQMFTLRGGNAGTLPVTGISFMPTGDGGVVGTDGGHYVKLYSPSGQLEREFGNGTAVTTEGPIGAPFDFYQQGGVAPLPDGRFLVADTHAGIMLLSPQGTILGQLAPSAVSRNGLSETSYLALAGGYVYAEAGPPFQNTQSLVRMKLSDLLARTTHGENVSSLGMGAGFVMKNTDLYVRPGQPVRMLAQFDPWWGQVAAGYTLCYQVRSLTDLRDGEPGQQGTVPVAKIVAAPGNELPLPIPKTLAPGSYQLDALLVRNDAGRAATSSRLYFSVGAPGDRLNLDRLPEAADWGGPTAARAVALSSQLGLGVARVTVDWAQLLDKGAAAPLDVASYLPQLKLAAQEARHDGVVIDLQVGSGGPEKTLVANGTWGARVAQLVDALKPYVHVWEAWNEPDNTFGSPADYVDQVLKPFYQAVHNAEPGALVVGGTVTGVNLGYWQGIIAAGGLNYMDVAATHPYTGHNRSWEENGTVPQLQQLRAMLVKNGHRLPLWDTEQAWWSDGPYDLIAQADNSARALLWMRALGMGNMWSYFIPEGGWGNNGVSFSAIQVGSYVKPSALAIMTANNELAGRRYLGQVPIAAPNTYAMRFGPKAGAPGNGQLLVAWTDGLRLPTVIGASGKRRVTITTELGESSARTFSRYGITLDSGPVYLNLSGQGALSIRPVEPFGADLLKGAAVGASSSNESNPASAAVDGIDGANGGGDLAGLPMWASAPGDRHPWLVATLSAPRRLDRIVVGTHSIGSIVTGLRDYDVQVRRSDIAPWRTVARIRGQFYDRHALIRFSPAQVAQVRVRVWSVNYSGYADNGVRPSFWPTDAKDLANPASPWYGPAVISELSAFAPGT